MSNIIEKVDDGYIARCKKCGEWIHSQRGTKLYCDSCNPNRPRVVAHPYIPLSFFEQYC